MKTLEKKLIKRTYTLPAETLAKFEATVPAGRRGAAVNEAIDHWLEEKRLADLRARIEEGLNDRENEALYLEEERVWAPISDELWSHLPAEEWPEPSVVWPDGLKAEREKHGSKFNS